MPSTTERGVAGVRRGTLVCANAIRCAASASRAYREYLAEFFGSLMILLFGAGVECQVRLHYEYAGHKQSYGNYLSCRLAWAGGVALGAWVAGGISGAHINPAVTLALGAFRGFPARKIPGYLLAQTLGCMVGALLIYFLYRFGISDYEGSLARTVHGPHATAGLFFTMPLPFVPLATAYVTEAVATGTLLFLVLAFMDQDNWGLHRGLLPIGLFFAILGIGSSLGANTGYALNPARDLGPRLALCFLGYGWDVWTHDKAYWFWGPVLSTVLGGLLGTFLYDVLLYTGEDSWVNQREETPEQALFLSAEERSGSDGREPARSS